MRLKELKQKLKEEKISPYRYSFDEKSGYIMGDTTVLVQKDGKWQVYYTERGSIFNLHVFNTEEEACEYFYQEIEKVKDDNLML